MNLDMKQQKCREHLFMKMACFHSAGLHDYLKYLKYGYSKVTDHASREIRLKRMTRETGIKMVEKYTNRYPKDLNLF